jgi:hypothetical protein
MSSYPKDQVIKRRREDATELPSHPQAPSHPVVANRKKPILHDSFWESFYVKPARVEPMEGPIDYDAETNALVHLCRTFVDCANQVTEESISKISKVSNDFALESPLTPPSSIAAAIDAGYVGETFSKHPFSVCRCRRDARKYCEKNRGTDWYSGPCGEQVVRNKPYSFVHVNLSRQIPSVQDLVSLLKPAFGESRLVFRMLPGDSELTVTFLTRDRDEEKKIRKLLREDRFRVDNGIRIFQITNSLYGK